MISPTPVDVGRHSYQVFATAVQYHQNRPGHTQAPRVIADGLRTDDPDEVVGWNVVFHHRDDDSRLGDVVAYRVERQSTTQDAQRSLLLLLAEDIPFSRSLDHWRLAVTQALHRGTLSDVRVDPKELFDDVHDSPPIDPERTYRNPDGSETWWRTRVTFHREVRIETRIKTLQATDGQVTAQDATISITDGQTLREFGVPIAVLDQVIAALHRARDDAEAINHELDTRLARHNAHPPGTPAS
ncbi:hypothetical protein [Gordonia sp. MP11Mi]|uniref:Uncharacterized protein n=1 Tax=Gordonia sp. MP11Mi TaxID=3022769 RepID=A0AA97GS80_9ACTN